MSMLPDGACALVLGRAAIRDMKPSRDACVTASGMRGGASAAPAAAAALATLPPERGKANGVRSSPSRPLVLVPLALLSRWSVGTSTGDARGSMDEGDWPDEATVDDPAWDKDVAVAALLALVVAAPAVATVSTLSSASFANRSM